MCIHYAQGCALCVGDFEAFKGLFIREYSGIFEKKSCFLNILTSSIIWKHPKYDIFTRSVDPAIQNPEFQILAQQVLIRTACEF